MFSGVRPFAILAQRLTDAAQKQSLTDAVLVIESRHLASIVVFIVQSADNVIG